MYYQMGFTFKICVLCGDLTYHLVHNSLISLFVCSCVGSHEFYEAVFRIYAVFTTMFQLLYGERFTILVFLASLILPQTTDTSRFKKDNELKLLDTKGSI